MFNEIHKYVIKINLNINDEASLENMLLSVFVTQEYDILFRDSSRLERPTGE